jgi:hypothetical protein
MPDFVTHFEMAIDGKDENGNAKSIKVLVDKKQELMRFLVDGKNMTVRIDKLEEQIASAKLVINMGPIHPLIAHDDEAEIIAGPHLLV